MDAFERVREVIILPISSLANSHKEARIALTADNENESCPWVDLLIHPDALESKLILSPLEHAMKI